MKQPNADQADYWSSTAGQKWVTYQADLDRLLAGVLDAVLDLARSESITWVRTTRESLPEGLSLRLWWRSLQTGGLIKWLILQLLSGLAIPRLRRAGLQTNRRFALPKSNLLCFYFFVKPPKQQLQ